MCHGARLGPLHVVICAALGLFLLVGTAQKTAATQTDPQYWTCKAEGIYTTCAASRSLKPCQDYRAEGIGVAEDKIMASVHAEGTCSEQMMRLISLENMNGRANVKTPCIRVLCEQSE